MMSPKLMKRILVYALAACLPIAFFIFFHDFYHDHSPFALPCLFHQLTGLWCPGCGGQRALHFLLHGQFLTALRHNVLVPFVVAGGLYLYYMIIESWILGNQRLLNSFHISPRYAGYFIIFLALYAMLRNIPASPFVYLAPPVG